VRARTDREATPTEAYRRSIERVQSDEPPLRRPLLHEDDFDGAVAPQHVHADVLAVPAQLEVDEAVADPKVADPDRLEEARLSAGHRGHAS